MISVVNPYIIAASSFDFGNALRFDGVNDYVDLDSAESFTGDFSLFGWIKKDAFSTRNIFSDRVSANNFVAVLNSTTIRVNISGTFRDFTVPTMSADTWYNYVITRSGTDTRLYFDGTESVTTPLSTSNTFTLELIGSIQGSSFYWDGVQDEIAWYDSSASAQDATDWHNSGNGALATDIKANPVLFLRFNASAGSVASDSSSSANDGNLTNYVDPDSAWEAH